MLTTKHTKYSKEEGEFLFVSFVYFVVASYS